MPSRTLGLALFAALMLLPVADASVPDLFIKPNPVAFGGVPQNGGKTLQVIVANEGSADAQPRITISSGASHFKIKEGDPFTCGRLRHSQRCTIHVTYHPSGSSQDSGTLLVRDRLRLSNHSTAQLTGHRLVTHPPSCTLAAKRHQQIIRQVTKNGKKVLKRTPFALSLTQNEDGDVSAFAAGKTDTAEAISLTSAGHAATAGNGVQLKLPLKQPSEQRIIAEIKKNLVPQMKLTGTCSNSDGDVRQVHAVIRFTDSKAGKPFGFPLVADPTPT